MGMGVKVRGTNNEIQELQIDQAERRALAKALSVVKVGERLAGAVNDEELAAKWDNAASSLEVLCGLYPVKAKEGAGRQDEQEQPATAKRK